MYMKNKLLIIFSLLLLGFFLSNISLVKAQGLNQQPTIAIPTVTGTPKGVTATVLLNQEESINVRSGPGVFFDKVGVLLPGQEAAVRGRSAGGDWVMIDYPGGPNNIGWIYAPVVQISPGELPIIEPPPTPTPLLTQTINPTLAAQFIIHPKSNTPADIHTLRSFGDPDISGYFKNFDFRWHSNGLGYHGNRWFRRFIGNFLSN